MKKQGFVVILLVLAIVFSVCAFTACGKNNDPEITLNVNPTTQVEGKTITATVATDAKGDIAWSVSDETILKINTMSGKFCSMTALKAGEAEVTVKVGEYTKSQKVTVTSLADQPKVVISYNGAPVTEKLTVNQNGTLQLSAATVNTTEQVSTWSSSSPATATVSENGLVTGLLPGKVTITAAVNSSLKAEVEVEIVAEGETYALEFGENGYTWAAEGWGPLGNVTENPGKWFYWIDQGTNGSNVEMNAAVYVDGAVIVNYGCSAGSNSFGVQLFYDYAENVAGKTYKLTMTAKSEKAVKLSVNGASVSLEAGVEAPVEVIFQEPEIAQYVGASISIQINVEEGDSNVIVFSNVGMAEHKIEGGNVEVPAEYELVYGEQSAANNLTCRWYFWKREWADVSGTYNNGTIALTADVNEGEFFAVQLFYKNFDNKEGNTYKLSFNFNSPNAGIITVNGVKVDIVAGDNTVEVEYVEGGAGNASVSIQFGETGVNPGANTPNAIGNGTFTLSNVNFTLVKEGTGGNQGGNQGGSDPEYNFEGGATYTVASDAELVWNDEGAGANNTFIYWNVQDASWNCGSVVTMNTTKYENGAVTLAYVGGDRDFSVQLFYKNTEMQNGKVYKVNLKINASVAGTCRVNGKSVALVAGDNDVEAVFTLANGSGVSALDIQFNGSDSEVTYVVSNILWTAAVEKEAEADDVPYGENGYTWAAEGWGPEGDATKNPDRWYYWNDAGYNGSTVTVSSAKINNGVLTATYTCASGENDYGFQLFYDYSANEAGKKYTLTLTIASSLGGKVNVNGKDIVLVANEAQTVVVTFEEPEVVQYHGASVTLGFAVKGGDTATVTVSGMTMVEATGDDNGDNGGNGEQGDEEMLVPGEESSAINNKYIYWHVAGDWGCGTIVTMKEASYKDGVVTLSYVGGSVNYSVQLFYKNTELEKGKTYKVTLKLNASAAGEVTVNGQVKAVVAGDNEIEVEFVLGTPTYDGDTIGISALDIQFWGGEAEVTYQVSNVSWEAVESGDNGNNGEQGNNGEAVDVSNNMFVQEIYPADTKHNLGVRLSNIGDLYNNIKVDKAMVEIAVKRNGENVAATDYIIHNMYADPANIYVQLGFHNSAISFGSGKYEITINYKNENAEVVAYGTLAINNDDNGDNGGNGEQGGNSEQGNNGEAVDVSNNMFVQEIYPADTKHNLGVRLSNIGDLYNNIKIDKAMVEVTVKHNGEDVAATDYIIHNMYTDPANVYVQLGFHNSAVSFESGKYEITIKYKNEAGEVVAYGTLVIDNAQA